MISLNFSHRFFQDLTNTLEEVTIRVVWRVSMWGGTQELIVKLKGTDSSDSTLEEVWQGNLEDLEEILGRNMKKLF